MKKIIFTAAILALVFPSFLSGFHEKEKSEPQTALVTAAKADIFLEASQHSIVIDTIPKGTMVTLFPSGKKNKKWLYISYLSEKRGSQVTGFVDSKRVEIIEESPGPAEEKTQDEDAAPEDLNDLLQTMQQEKVQTTEEKQQDEVVREKSRENTQMDLNERLEAPQEAAAKEENDLRETSEEHPEKNEETAKSTKTAGEKAQEKEEKTAGEKDRAAVPTEESQSDGETPAVQPPKTEVPEIPKVLTKVTVKVPRANIRLMPTTQSPIINQVVSGKELKHVAKSGNWHRINLPPNAEGIVLSGYIHQNIVDEIFESIAPPDPEPEKTPEIEPETEEEKTKSDSESDPQIVKEAPGLQRSAFVKYYWVGGGAGYTMPSQSYFGKGMNFCGTVGIGVSKHFAVELRVPYFQRDVSSTQEGLSAGRLSSLSLMLSVQGRYPIQGRFVPYLVAGGDYHLNNFSLNDEIIQAWNNLGFHIQESVDHTFGFHFGAGLDVFVLRNIVLNLDARYYTANLTGDRTLAHLLSQETSSGAINGMKLNSLQAGISIKLFLGPGF